MLRGHIDVVTSSGYIDGWAFDRDEPTRPLTVSILAKGQQVAHGVANRYRPDLVDAGIGTGWCAFRLRASGSMSRLSRSRLSLSLFPGNEEIFQTNAPNISEDNDLHLKSVRELVSSDPTLVDSIGQLRGCNFIFSKLIDSNGIEVFIRAAYIYVLNRPADPSGLVHYDEMIRSGKITPFGLLEALGDSDEFRSAPRSLTAPTQPGFIFSAL